MKSVVIFYFALFFLNQINLSESIRCGNECPFVFTAFNFTMPTQTCTKIVEKANGQCSLVFSLDFTGPGGGGLLMMQDRESADELRIETKFGLRSNVTETVVFYTCSSNDNCAFEFLRELFGPTLAEFNVLTIQNGLRDILYTDNPPPTGVECVTQRCGTNLFCQGQVIETLSPQSKSTEFNSQFDCVTPKDDTAMLFVQQRYFYPSTTKTNLTIVCNEPSCNSELNLKQVYAYFNGKFKFPANFSVTSIDPTPPDSAANSILVHWTMFFVMLVLVQSLVG